MGKLTFLGWSKSWDEIPQPTSVLLGANLTRNYAPVSTQPKLDPDGELSEEAAGRKVQERRYAEAQAFWARKRKQSGSPPDGRV